MRALGQGLPSPLPPAFFRDVVGGRSKMLSGVYFLYDCACAILLAARMNNALTHKLNTGMHTRVGV